MDSLSVGVIVLLISGFIYLAMLLGYVIWMAWRTFRGREYLATNEVFALTLLFSMTMGIMTLGVGIAMSGHLHWVYRCLTMLACTSVGLIMGGTIMEKRGFLLVRRVLREWLSK